MKKVGLSLFLSSLLALSFLSSCKGGGKDPDPVTPEPTPTPVIDYEAMANSYNEEITEHKELLKTYPENLNKAFNLLSTFETNLIRNKNSSHSIDSIIAFREVAYTGTEWDLIASSTSTSVANLFNTFKNSQYAKDNWLKAGENYIDQFGLSIDFYHMLAVLNTYMYSGISERELASYGGDICQLVTELKGLPSGTDLEDYATNQSKLFSDYDLYADIDGANIYRIYSGKPFYKNVKGSALSFSSYYINLQSNKSRMEQFVANTFSKFTVDDIYSDLSSNLYLILWNKKNGISFSSNKDLFKIAIKGFINRINKVLNE